MLRKIVARHGFLWLGSSPSCGRWRWRSSFWPSRPVDLLVHSYNTRRDSQLAIAAPSVQIMWHDVNDSGLLAILPLLDAPQSEIREGIRRVPGRADGGAQRPIHLPPSIGPPFKERSGHSQQRLQVRVTARILPVETDVNVDGVQAVHVSVVLIRTRSSGPWFSHTAIRRISLSSTDRL